MIQLLVVALSMHMQVRRIDFGTHKSARLQVGTCAGLGLSADDGFSYTVQVLPATYHLRILDWCASQQTCLAGSSSVSCSWLVGLQGQGQVFLLLWGFEQLVVSLVTALLFRSLLSAGSMHAFMNT